MMMIVCKLPEGSEQSGRPILSSEFHRTSSNYIFEWVLMQEDVEIKFKVV